MPDWRYYLCQSPVPGVDPTVPLSRTAWLRQADDRSLDVAINRGGELGFSYPVFDRWASYLFSGPDWCILAERDGKEIWSGPLSNNSGTSVNKKHGKFPVKAVGWLELFTVRELREDVIYGPTNNYSNLSNAIPGRGTEVPAGHTASEGTSWKDYEIIRDLINRVIGYDPAHAPPMRWGMHTGQAFDRQIRWSEGTKVETCFTDLTNLEAGLDLMVDPVTRLINTYAYDAFPDHPELVFGYNKPPFNVSEFSWQIDYFQMRNRMPVNGNPGVQPALVEDTASQSRFGIFEETVNLSGSGASDSGILLAYGGAEVALKKLPWVIYSIKPKAWQKKRMPRMFDDFDLGHSLRFSVDYGPIQEQQLAIRAFGASLSITNTGMEVFNSLTTNRSGAG